MRFRFGTAPPPKEPEKIVVGPVPVGATVVLLVDDEPAARGLFGMALRREGYHVLEAGNGVEALEVASQAGRLDLVVTDVVMPVMKGPELAAKLRGEYASLPFIFISGYLVSDELGPNSYMLTKPFVRQDLVKKVYEVIGPPKAVEGT